MEAQANPAFSTAWPSSSGCRCPHAQRGQDRISPIFSQEFHLSYLYPRYKGSMCLPHSNHSQVDLLLPRTEKKEAEKTWHHQTLGTLSRGCLLSKKELEFSCGVASQCGMVSPSGQEQDRVPSRGCWTSFSSRLLSTSKEGKDPSPGRAPDCSDSGAVLGDSD